MNYLVSNNYLRGDAAVYAVGWAEDRREELERALKKKKLAEEWGRVSGAVIGSSSCKSNNTEGGASDQVMMAVVELLVLGRQVLVLLKIAVALLVVAVGVGGAIFLKK